MKGRRIRELTSVVQKRFKFPEGSVELYAEKASAAPSTVFVQSMRAFLPFCSLWAGGDAPSLGCRVEGCWGGAEGAEGAEGSPTGLGSAEAA